MNFSAAQLFAAVLLVTSGFAVAREPSPEALERAHTLLETSPFVDCDADTELIGSYHLSGWQPGVSTDADTDHLLLQLVCWLGAYNQVSVFVADNGHGAALLGLPTPVIDLISESDVFESDDAEVRVVGYTTAYTFINAYVDEETGLIGEFALWRGIGDASSTTEWRLRDGQFVLEYYAADATYDLEVNPVVVFDYRK